MVYNIPLITMESVDGARFTKEINEANKILNTNFHKEFKINIFKKIAGVTLENTKKLLGEQPMSEYDGNALLQTLNENSYKSTALHTVDISGNNSIANPSITYDYKFDKLDKNQFLNMLDICFKILDNDFSEAEINEMFVLMDKNSVDEPNESVKNLIEKYKLFRRLLASFINFSGKNHQIIHLHDNGLDPHLDDSLAMIILIAFSVFVNKFWGINIPILFVSVAGNNTTRRMRAASLEHFKHYECFKYVPINFESYYLEFSDVEIPFPSYPYSLTELYEDSHHILPLKGEYIKPFAGLYISGHINEDDHIKIFNLINPMGKNINKVFAQTTYEGNFNINKDLINDYNNAAENDRNFTFIYHGDPIKLGSEESRLIYNLLPPFISHACYIALGNMIFTEDSKYNRADPNGGFTTAVMRTLQIPGSKYNLWIDLNLKMLELIKQDIIAMQSK